MRGVLATAHLRRRTGRGTRRRWSIDLSFRDPGTGRIIDLRNPSDQKEVKRVIKRDCPAVLIASPPCTAFSIASQGEVYPKVLAGAMAIIRFSINICGLQHKAGMHSIFEQPQSSRAWSLDNVTKMATLEGVRKATLHQCMYGLEARDQIGSALATNPCLYFSNHEAFSEVLQKRCTGGHRHVQLVGKQT